MEYGIYRNIKSGALYLVYDFATNSTNSCEGQTMVIYKRVKGETSVVYVREINEFRSKFDRVGVSM